MFSSVRSFLGRHRRKFMAGGLLVGGFVLATRYSRRKLREWQEREVRELLERTRRGHHFEATERSCNQMIIQLSACLRQSIVKALDTESAVEALRKGCDDKVARWNELKSLAITRSALVVYSTTMLVVFLRIQLNLVGGLMFKSAQNTDASGDHVDEAERQNYLELCGYLMSDGVDKLARFIREKVDEATASVSLMDKLTLRDLEQIYWSIVSSVAADPERDPVNNMTSYVVGERARQNPTTKPLTANMIRETIDLLESEEVRNLTRTTIRSGFAMLVDHISEYFVDSSDDLPVADNETSNATNRSNGRDNGLTNGYANVNKITVPMAKIIPIVNGQVRDLPKNGDIASDWLQANLVNDKFKILGANIYEAFSF